MSDRATLLAEIQKVPDIGTKNSDFVESLLDAAIEFLPAYVGLLKFPFLSQGFSRSGASPSTDIASLSENDFYISVDNFHRELITLTLANGTSGAAIASEMQTQIRSATAGDEHSARLALTTVTFASSLYTVTAPTYGDNTSVVITHPDAELTLLHALKLSPQFGGIEEPGSVRDELVERAVVEWVISMTRRTNLNKQIYDTSPQFAIAWEDLSPTTESALLARRKLSV